MGGEGQPASPVAAWKGTFPRPRPPPASVSPVRSSEGDGVCVSGISPKRGCARSLASCLSSRARHARPRGRPGARGWARWRASSGRPGWTSGAGPWGASALGSGPRLPPRVHLSSPSASCHLFWSPVTVPALLPPPPTAGTHFPTYLCAPPPPEDTREPGRSRTAALRTPGCRQCPPPPVSGPLYPAVEWG